MEQSILLIAAVVTIVGGGGLIGIFKNRELIKNTLADWTRRGKKVIYFVVSGNNDGDFTLYLYLCGEETSLFYPSTYENCEPYILAMRQIHYYTSHRFNSDRYYSKWHAMCVKPLSTAPFPYFVQLIDECKFRFKLSNDNGESITDPDSYKFKTQLEKCLKECEIEYDKKKSNPQDKWKARDK